jgi:hypothetical protein
MNYKNREIKLVTSKSLVASLVDLLQVTPRICNSYIITRAIAQVNFFES